MWKPSSIFISVLLVLDSFFVAYAVGLNSRHVLVVDASLGPPLAKRAAESTTVTTAPTPSTTATTATPATPTPAATSFTDLTTADMRLQSSLKSAADSGILDPTKDKKFRPNDPVTRADFTRWMVRVRQVQPIIPAEPTYADVPGNNTYYKDIEGATRANMVQGYTVKDAARKDFKPDQFITRQEFAVMYGTFSGKRGRAETLSKDDIDKYLRYNPGTTTFGELTYKDVGDVDDWARKWLAVAHQAGVLEQSFDVSPYNSTDDKRYLRPQQKMTRAEAVNILVKLYGSQSRSAVGEEPAAGTGGDKPVSGKP